jgi:hypothetical protein
VRDREFDEYVRKVEAERRAAEPEYDEYEDYGQYDYYEDGEFDT